MTPEDIGIAVSERRDISLPPGTLKTKHREKLDRLLQSQAGNATDLLKSCKQIPACAHLILDEADVLKIICLVSC